MLFITSPSPDARRLQAITQGVAGVDKTAICTTSSLDMFLVNWMLCFHFITLFPFAKDNSNIEIFYDSAGSRVLDVSVSGRLATQLFAQKLFKLLSIIKTQLIDLPAFPF